MDKNSFRYEDREFFEKTSYSTNTTHLVNEKVDDKFWIRPSQIVSIGRQQNFTMAFGKNEYELAALWICKFYADHGDTWETVSQKLLIGWIMRNSRGRVATESYITDLFEDSNYAIVSRVANNEDQVTPTNRFIERCAGFRSPSEFGQSASHVQTIFEIAETASYFRF